MKLTHIAASLLLLPALSSFASTETQYLDLSANIAIPKPYCSSTTKAFIQLNFRNSSTIPAHMALQFTNQNGEPYTLMLKDAPEGIQDIQLDSETVLPINSKLKTLRMVFSDQNGDSYNKCSEIPSIITVIHKSDGAPREDNIDPVTGVPYAFSEINITGYVSTISQDAIIPLETNSANLVFDQWNYIWPPQY
ncbi:hypothetical protein VA7868_03686 [Vibrio aerogenes CECT 7868]|uniref:Uncharacterized protein n=1 Tax=Vibrio aerogenes CECT 7868 TaxID=1216006 RepID=A0A1M6B1J4_9VIBR|nr:hypothetical protein [Vibrio aerogenes]SHI42560.1 hypothetical protein VA7868_03686 [Vibrio aerogenes CECT 7868]